MRQITNEAVNAFMNGRSFKKDNTTVKINEVTKNVSLLLYGNLIALLSGNELMVNHQGWKTNTTKERLNGVLDAYNLPRLSVKKGVWYIGNEEFNGCKTFEL